MPSVFFWVIVQLQFYAISVLHAQGGFWAAFPRYRYFREEKNSKTMTQKKIDGIKAYLKNVECGLQQPYCILLQ